MAEVAIKRFKRGGVRYMPGDEVSGLKAADRKELLVSGLIETRTSDAEKKAAEAYAQRVLTAEAKLEAAQSVLAGAEKALADADTEAKTKAAEKQVADGQKAVDAAEAALKAIKGD